MTAPDHPDLPVKPPLVFLLALLVGYLIDRYQPPRPRPDELVVAGIALVVIAFAIAIWAMRQFHAAGTAVEPWKPTRAIVESGPFAFSRNPIYVSFALTQFGIGLWQNRLAVMLMVIPALLATDRFIIRREEAYLERKFGAAYLDYKARVRRWI